MRAQALAPAAAEVLLVATLLLAAFFMRAVNLGNYSGDLDEGIGGMQMMLVEAGYRPYHDIYNSQGPLMLDLWQVVYRLYGGGTLEATRLAIGTYSLLGIVGVYWVARSVAGPVGAGAAALLLVLSPSYLRVSRQALSDMIALGPAALAVGCAIAYVRSGRRAWLVVAAVLFGISLAVKPIALAAGVPLGLAVLMRADNRLRNLMLVGGIVIGTVLIASLLAGVDGVLGQTVEYRARARDALKWRFQDNWEIMRGALTRDQPAIFALAVAGTGGLVSRVPRAGLLLAAWAVAATGLLLVYSPLFPKHMSTLMPPVAVLAGVGIGYLWRTLRERRRLTVGSAIVAVGLLWYLSSLPSIVLTNLNAIHLIRGSQPDRFRDWAHAVTSIRVLTEPGDFVLTDHPFLPFLAQRLVPPDLADPSKTRVRSRELTGGGIVESATAYPSKVAVLWTDRFNPLGAFTGWLGDNYVPVLMYSKKGDSPRTLHIRRDADLGAARTALTSGLLVNGAEFGGELRLAHHRLDVEEIAPAETTGLSLDWEAIRQPSSDYHVILSIVGPDGQVWGDEETSLFVRKETHEDWQTGRWVLQVLEVGVPAEAPPGDYRVVVELRDTTRDRAAPITRRPAEPAEADDTAVTLDILRVGSP